MRPKGKPKTSKEWDGAWGEMLGILQDFADAERVGYQLIMLGTVDFHDEQVVGQVLPEGIEKYEPDEGYYSDGRDEDEV